MKIGYWPIKGRAYPMKLFFHYIGEDYEEETFFKFEDWFKIRKKQFK